MLLQSSGCFHTLPFVRGGSGWGRYVVLPSFVRRGLRGGRSRAFFTVLLLALISAVFFPAVTGCSGSGAASDAELAIDQKSTVYYIDDHLGSAQMLTDGESGVLYEGMSAPYGLDLNVSAASESADENGADYSYTTKEIDRETGLVYFGKRYYSPNMGRWLTPDPMFLQNPSGWMHQTSELNVYSYVKNNPMSYVDPFGEDAVYVGINLTGWIAASPFGSNRVIGDSHEFGIVVDVKSFHFENLFESDNYAAALYQSHAHNASDEYKPSSGIALGSGLTVGYLGMDTSLEDFAGTVKMYQGAMVGLGMQETVTESGVHGLGVAIGLGKGGGLGTTIFEPYTMLYPFSAASSTDDISLLMNAQSSVDLCVPDDL